MNDRRLYKIRINIIRLVLTLVVIFAFEPLNANAAEDIGTLASEGDATEESYKCDDDATDGEYTTTADVPDVTEADKSMPKNTQTASDDSGIKEPESSTITLIQNSSDEALSEKNKTIKSSYLTVFNGVDYAPVYNYNYYVTKYGDLWKAFGTDDNAALRHFIIYGMKEGRMASDAFDVYSYKNAYSDLRSAFGTDIKSYYEHYLKYGLKEGF